MCKTLKELYQRDQEMLQAANKIRADRSQTALFYPILRVLPENRHLVTNASIENQRLKFSLQKHENEPEEFDLQLINPEYDYAHVVSILESC